jgi:hypothetical protein
VAGKELQFRGAIDREHGTKIVTNEKLKSIQKFALVIITRFSMSPQRQLLLLAPNEAKAKARQWNSNQAGK